MPKKKTPKEIKQTFDGIIQAGLTTKPKSVSDNPKPKKKKESKQELW